MEVNMSVGGRVQIELHSSQIPLVPNSKFHLSQNLVEREGGGQAGIETI